MPNLYEILRSICFALWQIRSETEIAAVQFMFQLFFLAGDLCRSWFRRIDQTIRTRCCQDKNPHARPVNMSSKIPPEITVMLVFIFIFARCHCSCVHIYLIYIIISDLTSDLCHKIWKLFIRNNSIH